MSNLPVKSEELIVNILQEDPEHTKYLTRLRPDKLKRIQNSHNATKYGLHTVAPLYCFGFNRCPFQHTCPIVGRNEDGTYDIPDDDQFPINQPCIKEYNYMKQKLIDYIQYLDISPENIFELGIANDLALIDLYKNRALAILSGGDRDNQGRDLLRVDETLTATPNGTNVSQTTTIHPIVAYIDLQEKRRIKLMDELEESRKSKRDRFHKLGQLASESELLKNMKQMRLHIEAQAQLGPDEEQLLLGD